MEGTCSATWTKLFEGVKFHAGSGVIKILHVLISDYSVEVEESNARAMITVPTWHVFYRGVRILALDVNNSGILCRFLKLAYLPTNIKQLPEYRPEKWGKGKSANMSLRDDDKARTLSKMLFGYLKNIDAALDEDQAKYPKPILDKKHLREQHFEKEVVANLQKVKPGLTLVRQQCVIPAGRIDVLCKDEYNRPAVLELKIAAGDESAVVQTRSYLQYIRQVTQIELVGIIVIQENNESLQEKCDQYGIELVVWK